MFSMRFKRERRYTPSQSVRLSARFIRWATAPKPLDSRMFSVVTNRSGLAFLSSAKWRKLAFYRNGKMERMYWNKVGNILVYANAYPDRKIFCLTHKAFVDRWDAVVLIWPSLVSLQAWNRFAPTCMVLILFQNSLQPVPNMIFIASGSMWISSLLI